MSNTPPRGRDRRDESRVSEHLPAGYTAAFEGESSSSPANAAETPPDEGEPAGESSLKLQGGDIHRELFKINARARMQRRAATFHDTSSQSHREGDEEEFMPVHDQLAPQGFRREFLQHHQRANFLAARLPVSRNFVEFLDLYGSFAGEDLHESDDEAITEDEATPEEEAEAAERPTEPRPLLMRRRSSRAMRAASASVTKTFFTLVKAFVGTGIMFLPKAFNNGGILFSSMAMLFISAISMFAFHLLLECKGHYDGGYGEIGYAIGGRRMRGLILGSITLSQLGFVCAGMVFVAENLTSFLEATVRGHSPLSAMGLIFIELLALIPLSFIRNIAKLGPAALLADVFILIGLGYIYYYDVATLASHGMHETVVLFNPKHYTLTIGAAIFTFEGIGLILPIQSSMARPERFEPLLGLVMLIITVIFTSVGALSYATFGENTKIEVINNYPQDSKLVNAVQFIYALAVLIGTPVQLFPPLRILEGKIFGRQSGKKSLRTKWVKNAFRTLLVCFCGVVSILGAGNLDRFVALIGSFACVPLVYIYPPYLHYRALAKTWQAKTADVALIILGIFGMIYTTTVTIVNSFLY